MVYRRTARTDSRREATRGRLLEAARTLIVKHGYDATTMQQIVDEAGTSIGNAYFYFPNKVRLLTELVELITTRAWDATEVIVHAVPPGHARIGTIIYANLLNVLGADRDIARLLFVTDRRAGATDILRDLSIARWQPHLRASYPDRSASELDLAASAIFGANRTVIERALSGAIDVEHARLARDMVRWSLRALGASDAEITSALRGTAQRIPAATARTRK